MGKFSKGQKDFNKNTEEKTEETEKENPVIIQAKEQAKSEEKEVSMFDEIKELGPKSRDEIAKKLGQLQEPEGELAEDNPYTFPVFVFCTPDLGMDSITIAGHEFPKFTCEVGQDLTGQDTETPVIGNVKHWTKEEYERVKKVAGNFGVEFSGYKKRKFMINGRRFQRNQYNADCFIGGWWVKDLVEAYGANWAKDLTIEFPTWRKRSERLQKFKGPGTGWTQPNGEKYPIVPPFSEDKISEKSFVDSRQENAVRADIAKSMAHIKG